MDELVEGVLSVGAWFSPDDGSSGVVHALTTARDVLAVALHVTLLEVGCKAVHVLQVKSQFWIFNSLHPAPDQLSAIHEQLSPPAPDKLSHRESHL